MQDSATSLPVPAPIKPNPSIRESRVWWKAIASGGLLLLVCPSLLGAIATVTNTDDDGPGSLRQLISGGNSIPGQDILRFDPSLDGQTIHLTSGLIEIRDDLVIDASFQLTQGITIDAGGDSQIFYISSGAVVMDGVTLANGITQGPALGAAIDSISNQTLTLRNVCILNCSGETYGGGIGLSFGSLTMENCRLEGNTTSTTTGAGGGIYLFYCRDITITDSAFVRNTSGGGGAIFIYGGISGGMQRIEGTHFEGNSTTPSRVGGALALFLIDSDMTIEGCEFLNNSAGRGGAVWDGESNGGVLKVAGSTFAGNTASESGGALLLGDSRVELVNVTASRNRAETGGAIYIEQNGELQLLHCTVSENLVESGGAIDGDVGNGFVTLEVSVERSIVAGNFGGDLSSGSDLNYISQGFNLIGNGDALGAFDQTGDQIDITDPLLAPLRDYGGRTRTMPPWYNSPAVDAGGIVNFPLTDQRGISKPVGSAPDIGAVEAITAVVANTNDSGPGSLRDALATIPTGGTIGFSPILLAGQTITLTSGQLSTDKKVAIGAAGLPGGITLDASSSSRILEVLPGGVVALDSMKLINGSATGNSFPGNSGGALFVADGDVILNRCLLSGNTSNQGGGAVFASSSELWVKDSTLAGNSAVNGGAIANDLGTAWIEQSTFAGNSASFGGALVNANGTLHVVQSTLAGNTGSFLGGGLASAADLITETHVRNSIVAGNSGGDASLVDGMENSFISGGGNVIGSGTGASAFTEPNDQTGITELLLEPLGDYGGPMPTRPPLPESPAIDNANAALPGADQRGYSRAFGTATDAGAVEYQGTLVVTSNADAGPGSLRDTMRGIGFGGVISFDPNLSGQTVDLTTGELLLDRSMNIDGSGLLVAITLDAGGASRVFRASGEIAASLDSLTLTGGFAEGTPAPDGYGGAMLVNEGANVALNAATVVGNNAALRGGGLALLGDSALTVENVTITQNEAVIGGAGIVQNGGELTVHHSTISGNGSGLLSGSLQVIDGQLNLTNSVVAGNAGSQLTIGGSLSGGNNFTDGDPLLAALNDFGGATQTMPPLPGSPVIDAGSPSAFAKDQRGAARPGGTLPDIGAVEAFAFSTLGLIDSDNDGIDDRLEPSYGLTVGTDDSTVDSDADGTPDGVEISNMTNPTDPDDDFRILGLRPVVGFDPINNPVLELTLRTFPGLSYGFETSSELPVFIEWLEGDFEATENRQTIQIEWPASPVFFKAIRR